MTRRLFEHSLTVIITAVISYFVFRPEVHAQFSCSSYGGEAPLRIECFNESMYARSVIWDFGDGSPSSREEGTVSHEYGSASNQPYEVTLTAIGNGKHALKRQVAVRAAVALQSPATISIRAIKASDLERTTKSCAISLVNDRHSSLLGETTRTFAQECRADPGFAIVDASFVSTSQTRATPPKLEINPDKTAVRLETEITSGPQIDRYRGWLRGRVDLVQERRNAALSVELAHRMPVEAYGRFPLGESIALDSVRSLVIELAPGKEFTVEPGQTLFDRSIAYSVSEEGGQLYLDVSARSPDPSG